MMVSVHASGQAASPGFRPPHDISFRPVARADLALLRVWLEQPHIRQWWGDPDAELGQIRDMVEGRDSTRPYLICVDGRPVGYIQLWVLGDHQNEEWIRDNSWLIEFPADTVGIDLSIGEADLLSKGIGSAALRSFVKVLVDEGRRNIIIDPDPDNRRAVRAYEKAGFRVIPHLAGKTEGVLLMQFDTDRPI